MTFRLFGHASYDEGFDDVVIKGSYDESRYHCDKQYAAGVDDALKEFDILRKGA